MYSNHQATQSEINAYRDAVRAQFQGQPFQIDSNGYGLRAECLLCCESNTRTPEMWMHEHACNPEVIAEIVAIIEESVYGA